MRQIQLLPRERVVLSCRTHWRNYVPPFAVAWLCITFLFVRIRFFGKPLILNLANYIGNVNYAGVSTVESAVMFVLALCSLNAAFKHLLCRYVITTERLILHKGFLNTETTELKLCYCSNLLLRQNLGGKILGYGDFTLRAGGVDIFFNDVPRPLRFKRALTEAINDTLYTRREETIAETLEEQLGLRP